MAVSPRPGQAWTEDAYRTCRAFLEANPPAGISGGKSLEAVEFEMDAPWQAELGSTYHYTKADIDADRKLPASDPHKYFLDRKQDWERQLRCGGVYIGDGWVLTAAHCLTAKDEKTGAVALLPDILRSRAVRLGTFDLSKRGPRYKIEAAIVHKGYLLDQSRDDIALLKVRLGRSDDKIGTQPAHILDPAVDPPLIEDDNLFVSGWGATSPSVGGPMLRTMTGGPLRASAHLKMAELKVEPNARCDAVSALHGTISDAVICAGSHKVGDDACTWDSGGPLVRAWDHTLVGLVSRGDGCGLKAEPAVYTKVSLYRDWIGRARKAPVGQVTILP